MDKDKFKMILASYVRPKLEYIPLFLSPYLRKHGEMRESDGETKVVPELRDLTHRQRGEQQHMRKEVKILN